MQFVVCFIIYMNMNFVSDDNMSVRLTLFMRYVEFFVF